MQRRTTTTHLSCSTFSSTKHGTWIIIVIGFIKSTITLFLLLLTISSLEFFHAFLFGSVLVLLCCAVIIIVVIIIVIIIVIIVILSTMMNLLLLLSLLLFRFTIGSDFQSTFV